MEASHFIIFLYKLTKSDWSDHINLIIWLTYTNNFQGLENMVIFVCAPSEIVSNFKVSVGFINYVVTLYNVVILI